MQKSNILQLIKQNQGRFSQQQAKIAAYILDNYDKAAFMTATQMAKEIGVSQPTMIRFSQFLGFGQFSMFLEALQSMVKAKLTSSERLKISLGAKETRGVEFDIIPKEIETLDRLANSFPEQAFDDLVGRICGCRKVFVVGTRGSASLAQYFGYFLDKVKSNVDVINCGGSSSYDRLLGLDKNDLVIAVAFPRYPRETIEIARFCSKSECDIYGVTDRIDSPLSEFTTTSLIIPITFSAIFDSYSSAVCLFNMVVTRVGRSNRKESETLSRRFEKLAGTVNIFCD